MKCFVKKKNVSFTDLQLQWEKFTLFSLVKNRCSKVNILLRLCSKIDFDKHLQIINFSPDFPDASHALAAVSFDLFAF